jgi:hypothetical protein
LRAGCGTCLTRLTRCLTKAVKPELETSTFWCLEGFFPYSPKKEAHCCLEQRGGGKGTLILNYLEKGKERLRFEEKKVSRLNA